MSSATCYAPNGDVVDGWQPCNTTSSSQASACCDLRNSVCTSTGLCFGGSGYLYRGGCTDRHWNVPECTNHCLDVTPDSHVNIFTCENGVWDPAHLSCCGGGNGASDCCAKNFTLFPGTPFAGLNARLTTNGSDADNAQTSASGSASAALSTVTITSTATATVTSSAQQYSKANTVGAAVGVPLGMAFLAMLGLLIFRERRWRKITGQNNVGMVPAAYAYGSVPPNGHPMPVAEIGSSPVHPVVEIGQSKTRQEMEAREVQRWI